MFARLKGKKTLYIIIAIAVALVVLIAVIILSNLGRQVSDPESESVMEPIAAGQNIVATVMAGSLDNMYGYQFQLEFDEEKLEFTGTVESQIDDITSIFSAPMEGYELVGATMIGDRSGVSGTDVVVCEIVLVARQDGLLDDFNVSITDIKIVTADLDFIEDVEGWTLECMVQE